MANNNYEDYDEIDDAILFKAEEGITYSPLDSPSSVHSPTHQPPGSADSPGRSVNDGIKQRLCSMSYITVDTVAKELASLGLGALMAKLDIEAAYRLVPVHPDERPLLAVRWKGEVFCDTMLPFGLRSAPKIFNAVADALEWCFK